MDTFCFDIFSKAEKETFITHRKGETRIGQCIRCCEEIAGDPLTNTNIKFVLLGMPEDIGVRANCGIGGADTVWIPFLKTFLNIQETDFLSGDNFLLYGHLKVESSKGKSEGLSLEMLRKETEIIDNTLFPVIQKIISTGKIPIVIGGGHNNAFPILKGAALAKKKPVNAVNVDAHADFRVLEGRHSGNGFSYAFAEGFLKKYFVLGLHEAYNNKEMIDHMKSVSAIDFIYWEDIFFRKKTDWSEAVQTALKHVSEDNFGVEIDVDCIEKVLSSAITPLGIQLREAVEALYRFGNHPNSIYLHIPEAVVKRADGLEDPLAGKVLSYLVQTFCKGVLERR